MLQIQVLLFNKMTTYELVSMMHEHPPIGIDFCIQHPRFKRVY